MDMQLLQVRADLERMVINYHLMNRLGEEETDVIIKCLDQAIGKPPPPAPKRKIIPFPGVKAPERKDEPEPVEERLQMEGFILLGYRHWDHLSDEYMAYYLPETGPRFIRSYYLYTDRKTGEIEIASWGRIRGRFKPNKDTYIYTDAVHLAPPNPDRRPEYLNRKAEAEEESRIVSPGKTRKEEGV